MQIDCQQCVEQIGAYVLYALSRDERTLVEGHLRSCARCSLFAYHLQSVTHQLPLAVAPMAPSPRVKQRMLAEIQNEITSQMVSAQAPLMTSVAPGVPASLVPPTVPTLTTGLMEQRVLILCETKCQWHARPSQEGQRCQCRRCCHYSTITTEAAVQEVQKGIQAGSEEQQRRQGACYRGRQDLRAQQHNRRRQRALQVVVHGFSAIKRQDLWLTLIIIAVSVAVLLSLLTGLKFIETILP